MHVIPTNFLSFLFRIKADSLLITFESFPLFSAIFFFLCKIVILNFFVGTVHSVHTLNINAAHAHHRLHRSMQFDNFAKYVLLLIHKEFAGSLFVFVRPFHLPLVLGVLMRELGTKSV